MKYLGYDVDVQLNGSEFTGNPGMILFTISDSIYDLFPRASLAFPDETVLFKSGGMLTDGFPIALSLGLDGKTIGCSYVVSQGETESPETKGFSSGALKLNLIHQGRALMTSRSRSLKGVISDVMSTVVDTLKFSSSHLEKTRGMGTWWQTGNNEEDLLLRTLLPVASSYSGRDTPMYLFGDSNDQINLLSFASMIQGHPVGEYTMAPQSPTSMHEDGISTFYDLRPFTEGLMPSLLNAKPRVVGYKSDDASMLDTKDSVYSHVVGEGDAMPLPNPKGDTRLLDLGRQIQEPNEKIFWQAKINNSYRSLLSQEKILVTLPLDPTLVAGKLLSVKVALPDLGSKGSQIDSHYTGTWLAESTVHAWIGSNKKGTTQAVLIRGKTKLGRSLMKNLAIIS